MDPGHGRIAVARPAQPQRLAPERALLLSQLVDLRLLRLAPALLDAHVSRRPARLAALVHELGARLLERRDCLQREFRVGCNFDRGARDDHGAQGLVGFEVFFLQLLGDGDQVGFEVFGVLDQGGGVDEGRERSCC